MTRALEARHPCSPQQLAAITADQSATLSVPYETTLNGGHGFSSSRAVNGGVDEGFSPRGTAFITGYSGLPMDIGFRNLRFSRTLFKPLRFLPSEPRI